MSAYVPPYRRKNKTQPKKSIPSPSPTSTKPIKLAQNEILLDDGRILIRGTLRKDGTRRPDRYKRAGFRNDEDMHRNKYIPRQLQAQKQKQQQKLTKESEGQNTIRYVESVVLNIIHDPPKSVHTDANHTRHLNVDFKQNVLRPLLNEFYQENEDLLLKHVTQSFTRNMNKCQELIQSNALRAEIIKFIHKLLFDKRNKRHLLHTNQQTKQRLKQNLNTSTTCDESVIRGKGNFSYGTGTMLSENIETQRRKQYEQGNRLKIQMIKAQKQIQMINNIQQNNTMDQRHKTDKKKRRIKVRKLNQ
eukprot:1056410_1